MPLVSVPWMALCCCHNARGQAVRSLTTGELQASLNRHHPHHRPAHRQLTCQQFLPPPDCPIFDSGLDNFTLTLTLIIRCTCKHVIRRQVVLGKLYLCMLLNTYSYLNYSQCTHVDITKYLDRLLETLAPYNSPASVSLSNPQKQVRSVAVFVFGISLHLCILFKCSPKLHRNILLYSCVCL